MMFCEYGYLNTPVKSFLNEVFWRVADNHDLMGLKENTAHYFYI